MTDPSYDPWAASCGSGLLIGSGADAWLMLWATYGERGPFHVDGIRGAGLTSTDRYVGLALHVDGTFDFLTTDRTELEQARTDLRRLHPGLIERDADDPDGLWDFG